MDRRNFIKLTAVTGTGAALASCGNPEHQLIRFVPDEEITPGLAEWKPSICPVCGAGCGVNVRVMDADISTVRNGQPGVVRMNVAKKLEGLATDPISRGGLCARGQAAIQLTYHPDRVAQPMKRTGARGSGSFAPVAWDEAIAELAAKVDGLDDKKALAIVMRPRRGSRQALFAEFARRVGAPAPVAYELFADDVLRQANGATYGKAQRATYDLAKARYVISFGADFLGTWGSVVAQNAAFGDMRQGRRGVRGKLVQVEARMTTTGASADEWVPTRPGTEGVLALALAGKYTPADAEKITGVPAKKIERLAKELAEQKPALAIVGGPALAHTNALFTAMAVNELNAALAGDLVGFTPNGSAMAAPGAQPFQHLANARVLLVDEANPAYDTPPAWKVREALERIPFIASFGSFVDDTSAYADLILPDHSFLESWVDATPESGSLDAKTTAVGPAMKPIHDTRATADVLIAVAGKLKAPIELPWKTAEEVAKSSQPPAAGRPPSATGRQAPAWNEPAFDGSASDFPFHFLPYASPAFGDGSTAHLPWLQELPDPLTSAMWSSWVEINPKTAEKMGIADGDLVDVTSSQGTLRAPAVVFPGIAPDIVAMPVGQGHEHFTRYASKRGANAVRLLAPITEQETGALAWAATRVRIARAGDGDGSLILFAGEKYEKPHEREIR
ncbi:MAG TPA: molybdopterin-dependent oxidoreductase [Vicinamibacterales bacterium]|nr:molybdopterin-dependent oxidoreductase [Vicinamibacterales bacterium]